MGVPLLLDPRREVLSHRLPHEHPWNTSIPRLETIKYKNEQTILLIINIISPRRKSHYMDITKRKNQKTEKETRHLSATPCNLHNIQSKRMDK